MDNPSDESPANSPGAPPAATSASSWGPDPRLRWISLALAVICIAWGLLRRGAEDHLVAVTVAVILLAVTLLLVRSRTRLAATERGLEIIGPLRRRTVPWAQVASIDVMRTGRFGRRAASLELEIVPGSTSHDASAAGRTPAQGGSPPAPPETDLYVFGAFELGCDPADVGRHLRILRAGSSS